MPDLTGIYYLAIVGFFTVLLAVIIGVPWLLWWLYHHIQFV